jgi:hypothetical protein
MDVKGYYRRLREKEAELPEGDLVVVSEATSDGGREGVVSVVPKQIACRLLVEGRARLASTEEKLRFEKEEKSAREAWQKVQEAQRIHVQVMNGLQQAATAKKHNGR